MLEGGWSCGKRGEEQAGRDGRRVGQEEQEGGGGFTFTSSPALQCEAVLDVDTECKSCKGSEIFAAGSQQMKVRQPRHAAVCRRRPL